MSAEYTASKKGADVNSSFALKLPGMGSEAMSCCEGKFVYSSSIVFKSCYVKSRVITGVTSCLNTNTESGSTLLVQRCIMT